MAGYQETLRKLSIRDEAYFALVSSGDAPNLVASGLEGKTHCLVRLAALAAIDAAPPSYMEVIEAARLNGASTDEIVGVLVAIVPSVGPARVVSAAPKLALGLGYDVGAALEDLGYGF